MWGINIPAWLWSVVGIAICIAITVLVAIAQEQERKAWWERYNAYLRSPEWRQRRALVLQRDNELCQCCRSARAQQVHHLSYKNVGHEPLEDLQSVCFNCHNALHHRNN